MTTITIAQKESNSGTIHDIESDQFDREIKFRRGTKYAVVLASFYGGNYYTTHCTEGAAVMASESHREYSHTIVGIDGQRYMTDGYDLYSDR